jgi:hypothetical protein
MAKKQTRRSISVSRTTYERLKAFCETNNISMSQFVETRVGDFLGNSSEGTTTVIPTTPRPSITPTSSSSNTSTGPAPAKPANPIHKTESRPFSPPQQVPMTSAAARFAVEPPPPVIKPKQEQPAPKPVEKKAEQIFTF